MLKKLLVAILFIACSAISAQTTLIDPAGDGGFENGTTFVANGWTPIVGPAPVFNQWVTNTGAPGYTGARCAYISNNIAISPPPYANTANQNFHSHFYKDITFPAGENDITLNFDWRGVGDANDRMRVWLVPTTFIHAWNAAISATGTAPTGIVQIGGNFNGQPTWTNTTLTIPSAYATGNTYRLVFEWSNNGAAGATPAAVDNISLVSQTVITYCTPTSTNTTYYINDFSTSVGGTTDISNLGSGFTAPGYEDNSATDNVTQFPGGEVDFTIILSTGTYGVNIWVDWDNDGDFLSDPSEKVFASGTYTPSFISDFVVPLGTAPGSYRMRVRADYWSSNPNPCGNITSGEAEDYTLVVPAISCTDDPSNITVGPIGITTATINWTAAPGPPAGGYDYFVTTNPNPIGYSQVPTGNTAATSVNLTGLTEDTTYYVWVRSVCNASFTGNGVWQGPELFNTLVTPPTTTNVSICPGDPSEVLTADAACVSGANLGNSIVGETTNASPLADILYWFTVSTDPCAFDTSRPQQRYATFDFQVDVAGTYTFTIEDGVTPFDAMGYIVYGGFTPGDCLAGGTYVAGDDDSAGTGLDAEITANLTPGITYTLVTTASGFGSPDIGTFEWDVAGPGTLLDPVLVGDIQWFASASGGAVLYTGTDFDPVADGPLPNTLTPGVYSFWAACSTSPSVRTQADFNVGKAWNGSINSDWNTAANWSPNGVPTATDCVVIPNVANAPVINAGTDGVGNKLVVQNGGILSQASNSTLTITDLVTVNAGGTYLINDSASLIQVNDVANIVNGTFSIARTANIRQNDYVYWSSPVTSFNVENISPGTPNGYKYEWIPTMFQGIGPPGNMTFGDWQSADTGVMVVGKGYAVKGPTGHGSSPSAYNAVFSGTPNNGIITMPIERGSYTGADYTQMLNGPPGLLVTSDDDNWNLIGNPYPSAIHLEDFLYHPAHSSYIDGVGYIWTHGTDIGVGNGQSFYDQFTYSYSGADYLAVNATGNSLPSTYKGFVASGQGFFVRMTDAASANETVEFHNYMRDSGYRNDQFFRSANSQEDNENNKHRIWLDFIDASGNTNTTLIGYVNGATNDNDRMFDAKNTRGEGMNLYSMINDDRFIIQGRQLPFLDTDTVPLGINITEAGSQTIAINTLEGLFLDTDQAIFIEDLLTGTIHDLRNAPYTFTSESGVIDDRLVLRYTQVTLSIDDVDILNGIRVFKENNNIVVKSDYETIQSIEIYDLLGRTLFENGSINLTEYIISALKPKTTTLLLKIKLVDGQQKIAKLIF